MCLILTRCMLEAGPEPLAWVLAGGKMPATGSLSSSTSSRLPTIKVGSNLPVGRAARPLSAAWLACR